MITSPMKNNNPKNSNNFIITSPHRSTTTLTNLVITSPHKIYINKYGLCETTKNNLQTVNVESLNFPISSKQKTKEVMNTKTISYNNWTSNNSNNNRMNPSSSSKHFFHSNCQNETKNKNNFIGNKMPLVKKTFNLLDMNKNQKMI